VCICALWGRDCGQGCRYVEVMVAMLVCEHTSGSLVVGLPRTLCSMRVDVCVLSSYTQCKGVCVVGSENRIWALRA